MKVLEVQRETQPFQKEMVGPSVNECQTRKYCLVHGGNNCSLTYVPLALVIAVPRHSAKGKRDGLRVK